MIIDGRKFFFKIRDKIIDKIYNYEDIIKIDLETAKIWLREHNDKYENITFSYVCDCEFIFEEDDKNE